MVTRHGTPITQHPLRSRVNTGITAGQHFHEWEACHAAGLDLWRWESGGYPVEFMAKVLAWHRLHNLVQSHTAEAAAARIKRR